jgi:hypothetical protein
MFADASRARSSLGVFGGGGGGAGGGGGYGRLGLQVPPSPQRMPGAQHSGRFQL